MNLDDVKAVYRLAIDGTASDREPTGWWAAIQNELDQVVAARTVGAAANVIAWWHNDWSRIGDTPTAAARRIRRAAATMRRQADRQTAAVGSSR